MFVFSDIVKCRETVPANRVNGTIYFFKHAIDFVHALLFSSSVLALINIIKVLRKQQSQFPQSILINRTRGEINIIMG